MEPKKTRHELLHSILEALVKEWGFENVSNALTQFQGTRPAIDRARSESNSKNSSSKPSPLEILSRSKLSEIQKFQLTELTNRFQEKIFLPSLNDAKNFLEAKGVEVFNLKHRSDAYRKILQVLAQETKESIDEILRSGAYSGPSKLGPLSDAIRTRGQSLRPADDSTVKNSIGSENIEKKL